MQKWIVPARLADLERERGRDDDLRGLGDVGELRLHLRALSSRARAGRCPPRRACSRLMITSTRRRMTLLLGGREVASLDARRVLAGAAEEGVDHGEDERRVADDQAEAAQRPHRDDVEVGRRGDLAQEGAVLVDVHRPDRDLGALPDEAEQAGADVLGEALVDDLERRHALADHAVLVDEVVAADAAFARRLGRERIALAGDALQQRVDFVLREDLLVH